MMYMLFFFHPLVSQGRDCVLDQFRQPTMKEVRGKFPTAILTLKGPVVTI
jgi:hypothetical protein